MPGLPATVRGLSPVRVGAKPPVDARGGLLQRVIPVIHALYIYIDLLYKYHEEEGLRSLRGGVITRLPACLPSPIMALPELVAATLPAEAGS